MGADRRRETPGCARPHILLVEDSPSIVQLVRHLLRDQADLTAAGTYSDALERIDSATFDLFLIDIQLGGDRTGVDLLNAIRDRDSYRSTPAVAVTAHALPGDRARLLTAGFDAYLPKPFTRSDLEGVVRDGLSNAFE